MKTRQFVFKFEYFYLILLKYNSTGNNFWQIWSNTKMYNWLDTSSIFNIQDVEKIKPYFPTNIDSAFQDNDNNVIIIKGPQYISIPAHRFPVSITITIKLWIFTILSTTLYFT